jgi:hypothetical protein
MAVAAIYPAIWGDVAEDFDALVALYSLGCGTSTVLRRPTVRPCFSP